MRDAIQECLSLDGRVDRAFCLRFLVLLLRGVHASERELSYAWDVGLRVDGTADRTKLERSSEGLAAVASQTWCIELLPVSRFHGRFVLDNSSHGVVALGCGRTSTGRWPVL